MGTEGEFMRRKIRFVSIRVNLRFNLQIPCSSVVKNWVFHPIEKLG